MCLFKTESQSISYFIVAKALLRLLVFDFTVERLFEGGALSIECNRILCSFERAPRRLFTTAFKLRAALFRVYMGFIAFEGFITFVVNFYYI